MPHVDSEIRVVDAFDTQDQHIPLTRFIEEFGDGLLDAVQSQNPAVYSGRSDPYRESVMDGLLRQPFPAQMEVVQAVTEFLDEAG